MKTLTIMLVLVQACTSCGVPRTVYSSEDVYFDPSEINTKRKVRITTKENRTVIMESITDLNENSIEGYVVQGVKEIRIRTLTRMDISGIESIEDYKVSGWKTAGLSMAIAIVVFYLIALGASPA